MRPIQIPDTYDPSLQAQIDAIEIEAKATGIQTNRLPRAHFGVLLVINPLVLNDGYQTPAYWAVEDYTGVITARPLLTESYFATNGTLTDVLEVIKREEYAWRKRCWPKDQQHHLASNGFPAYHLEGAQK